MTLTALGASIRAAREGVNLSADRLGVRAGLGSDLVGRVEHGQRTRVATLRMVALAIAAAELHLQLEHEDVAARAAELVDEWVELAGDQLAPPSPRQERIDQRRRKWAERVDKEAHRYGRALFLTWREEYRRTKRSPW